MVRCAFGVMLVAATLGCEAEPTQLVVVISTDMDIPAELAGYRLQVTSQEGRERLAPGGMSVPLASDADLPDSFGVRPIGDDPARRVRVDVTAVGADGLDAFTTSAQTYFLEGHRLRLDMFLLGRCLELECADGQTCRRGACEDIDIDPHSLPEFDPGAPLPPRLDAGTDAPADAGADAQAAVDAGRDAGADAAADAAVDAATDAGADAGGDAGGDASVDAGADAGVDAGPDASVACDPLGNCQNPNDACRVMDDGSVACRPRSPPTDPCGSDDECAGGQDCVLEPNSLGTCRPYCLRDADCGPSEQCVLLPVIGVGPPVGYCSMDCSVWAGCDSDYGCVQSQVQRFEDGVLVDARMCWEYGLAVDYEPCDDTDRCASGLTCYRPLAGQEQGLCRTACIDGGSDCLGTEVCMALLENGQALADGVCSAECNPEEGAPCEDAVQELLCTLEEVLDIAGDPVDAAVCVPRLGEAVIGEGCLRSTDCVAGLACALGVCEDVCLFGEDTTCAVGGTTCQSLNPPFFSGIDEYGVCE